MQAFESLGLTSDEVIEMQKWLYPTMAKSGTVSEMIKKVVDQYPEGRMRHYALYHLGNRIGEAQVKEQLGMDCILDPEKI